jgi:hypothetical protein
MKKKNKSNQDSNKLGRPLFVKPQKNDFQTSKQIQIHGI